MDATKYLGTDYDFSFEPGTKALYCHEYTSQVLRDVGFDIQPSRRKVAPFIEKVVLIDKDFYPFCDVVYEAI